MKNLTTAIVVSILAAFASSAGASADEVFEAGEHCVAYRTVKGMFFRFDVDVVGKSCEVEAVLSPGAEDVGARIAVAVPIDSLRSGNVLRDGAVSDLLGAEQQPDLRFVSGPLDVAAIRQQIPSGRVPLPGMLLVGGKPVAVVFHLELFEEGDRHFVRGGLETAFDTFGIEVPTIGPWGVIAEPGEALELVLQLELERVEGLVAWARQNRLDGP